jgi:hypothetical protein
MGADHLREQLGSVHLSSSRERQSVEPQATAIARRHGLTSYEVEDMVRTGVAFDWLPRYVEDEPASGTPMPCRRTLTRVRPRNTVSVSRSVTPTTWPVKLAARAGDAHLPPAP